MEFYTSITLAIIGVVFAIYITTKSSWDKADSYMYAHSLLSDQDKSELLLTSKIDNSKYFNRYLRENKKNIDELNGDDKFSLDCYYIEKKEKNKKMRINLCILLAGL
jgi:hypothetical protein